MPRELKFYGASDDLFEIEGTTGDEPDEVGCYRTTAVAKIQSATEGQLCVVGIYSPGDSPACWLIGLMPVEEGEEIPQWPMSWKLHSDGYSAELTLTVPDDAVVSMVGEDDES